VKYANFQQVTRAQSVEIVLDMDALQQMIPQLLKRTEVGVKPIRLIGLSLSGLSKTNLEEGQPELDFSTGLVI
jgi:DNA polymerase-4